jgi:hypothetical protein
VASSPRPTRPRATAVLRQVSLPHRIVTILEGESLLNDASALLIYRIAVTAMSAGSITLTSAGPTFLLSVMGSFLAGPVLALSYMRAVSVVLNVLAFVLITDRAHLRELGTRSAHRLSPHQRRCSCNGHPGAVRLDSERQHRRALAHVLCAAALFATAPIPISGGMHGVYHNYSAREAGQSVARLEALARLMDSQFVLPGTNFRIGLDPLMGLIPVVGDIISSLISTYLIWEARRLGAPKWLIARMMANTLLDTAVGSVPRRHMERRGLTCPKGPIIHGKAVPTG